MERIFIYAGLELHNLQNGTIDTLPIANEVIHYDYCGRNPWSFLHMQALWTQAAARAALITGAPSVLNWIWHS
jgi:hypothetical protein